MERGGQGSLFIDKLCNNKIEGELWRKKILFLTVGCINYNCDINFYEPLKQIFSHVINYNYIEKIKQIGKDSMNAEVIEIVRKEKPDYVLLHTYQDQIELKTLDAIGALGTKVIAWFSDDHWRFENYSKTVARHVFCSVTTDKHSVEKYVKSGLNVVKSQWASNQNYYKKIDSERIYDVTFVGQNYGRRRENLLYLKNNGVPIVVFGRGFGRFLEFDDIIKTFNASKINLNFSGSSSNDGIKQIKGRVFEVPMCGGFLLTEYVDGIEEYYEIGKEVECFENITEASEKISYYLKHDDKRIEIANRGYSRALKDHTWVKRLRGLFDELNKMQLAQSNVSCTFLPQEKEAVKPVNISHHVLRRPRKQVLLTTSAAPTQSPFSTKEKRPPVGIGFLISVLRNAGHEVFFIDNYLQPSNFLETDYLQKHEIDYVGIYANTICFRDTLRMIYKLEHLRQTRKWNGKIIVGGPHAAVAPDTIPGFVDYVVQGEGEQAILDIVDGKVADRIVRYPRIKDLDTLPMPTWDYFVGLPYDWSMKFISDGPVFTMNTSRGCPFRCAFCSVGSIWGKKYTYFSAERIVSDVEYLVKNYGAKGIYFREDNFTLNEERLRRFSNLLIEKGINISWVCESRVSNLSRDLVELMSRAGAKGFYLGVESGSQRILDFLHKDITVEQIKNAFKWCHEFGIKTAASIIIGVPGETESDIYETNELLREANPTAVWPNVFVGIPYSDLYHFVANNRLYQYIDDRGLVYLPGHNSRVKHYYRDSWNASIPDTEENKDWANKPKVSVLICVYNGEKFVRQALESIYNQTYQNFEVIIVDDGSTDKTPDILVNMKDSRTFIYRNPENLGLTKSLNIGLKLCRGQYIARMDADDISLPRRFEKQVEFLEKNSDYALVGSSYYHISEDGKIASLTKVLTGDLEIRQGLKKQNWFGHGTVMIRRDCFVSLGGYDEKYKFAQDYDLWLKVAEKYKVGNIDESLYCWRTTPLCISNAKKQEQKYYKNLAISEAQNRMKAKNLAMKGNTKSGKVSEKESIPMVSVIVPTYNRPASLVKTLKSVLNQTYQNFEIIVVNDAGTNVEDIVRKLNAKQSIVYSAHDTNKGLAATRNTGIKAAKGKYIAYLDDDDIYLPDHLGTLVKILESTDYKVAYTNAYRAHYEKVNENYAVTKRTVPYSFDVDHNQLLVRNLVPVLCVMHEKSCLDEVGYFDESLPTHEDWDLWIRMSRKFKFFHIKKVTAEVTWRTDGTTMTSEQDAPFLRIEAVYKKYEKYAINKPDIIERQKKYIQSLKQEYSKTSLRPAQGDTLPADSKFQESKSKTVSIIIPVFNNVEYTKQCLKTLIENTPNNLYEVIIIDNGSTDGTKELLKCLSGNVKIISNRENLGFARACNQGAAAADGNYLVFLNNDTEVQPGWLEELVKVLENDSEIVAVGSKLLYPDGSVQHAGVVILEIEGVNSLLPRHVFVQQPSDSNFANVPMVFQAVTAACMVVRKSNFESVNGFDESYWNGSEDVDLCFKLTKTQKKIVYQPKSVVIHYESKSGKERREGIKQNNKLLRQSWANKIKPDIVISGNQARAGISQAIQPYLKNNELASISRSQYINALIPWVKKFFVDGNRLPVKKLRFAAKTCTPSREKKRWGDTYFANSLAKAFMKLGHNCEVHFRDEWDQPDNHIDVVIHIKGRFRYIPKPHNFNILWIISHPELHTVEEINQFDVVFCASKFHFENLKNVVKIPCFYLPQATDENLFKPPNNTPPKDIDVLFVGTNYYTGKRRKIIQDVLDTGQKYNLCVVGKFWNGLLDKEYYKAEYVEHSELPQLYSRAKIVLNDHHETMKQFGFINNRTFDIAALKVFQISDYVKGIEELGIVTYQTPQDLREKLDYFLQNEKERERIAGINNQLCKNFTFINVARQIFDVVNKLSDEKSSRKIKDKRILPSEGKSADTLSAVSTSRSHPKVSVVVSCCNAEKFLSQCLDSIRNQTMHQWELFLLDDASTDGTRSIIEEYSRMDERIRPYYFQDNKGPYVRRNFAIERAGSDFIVIQDADDIMCPTKLEILYNEITKDQRLGIVGSFYRRFLEEFKAIEYTEKTELLVTHDEIIEGYRSRLKCDFCWHGSAIIRKELFEAIGLYDENPFGSDSFWLAKAAEYAYYSGDAKLKNIPEYLTLRRMHPASQMRILPSLDPRGRRRRYWQYCEDKLKKMRQRLERPPHTDIKTELKNCVCSDFIEKYSHLFTQWESEPLDDNVLLGLMSKAVELFNNRQYVTCIVRLNGIETIDRNIAKRFKNYDLLRAMAYFAIDRKEQSLRYLNREIQNHKSHTAKQFTSDYFEKQSKTTVQNWCQQNSRLYDLRLIDTESETDTDQKSPTVSGQQVAIRQSNQGERNAQNSEQVTPLVSIIVSCYNCENFLPECIESIKNQTMHEWELFLLDDASTDGTRSIIEEYSRMDKRIKPYYFQDNKGPYVRRNFAIERAGSDFIVIQDADDIMYPIKLEALCRQITSDERLGVVGTFYRSFLDEFKGLQYTDGHELPLEHNEIVEGFSSWRHVMSHGSAIIQKKLFEEIGLYDENRFSSDAFWFAKLAEYTKHCTDVKLKTVPEYLTLLRIHHSSQTQLLPGFDPRSRRIRYQRYCEDKLRKIRQNLKSSPDMDIKTELKNCICSDFNEKYSHLFAQWESEPLDNNILINRINWAVELFNRHCYVRCVSLLNCIETMDRNIVKRFKNYDLLRAMACFAVDRKEQSLSYLNREVQNHNNPAAKQFISDCFESQLKTDVQDWCSENGKLYDLRMIDTESKADIEQRSHTVSDEHIAVQQDEKGHSPQKLSCKQPISRGSAIMTDTDLARDMLLRLQKKDDSTSGRLKILFYFDRIGNFSRSSPAGTVIAVLNFARALLRSMPEASIHLTGNLVRYTEQHESFQIIPLPQADKRGQFIADYDVVFFATHVRYFQGLTKPSEQVWVLYQHCWEADDPVSLAHMNDFDAVICLSELHKTSLLSQGIGAEKLVAVPNLVDTDIYSPGDVSRNNQSIMYAGGIHPHKCIHILLDAFQLVRQQTLEAELHIYGDGAMWRGGDDYGNYLKSIKPQGAYFHGYIDSKDMPQIYSKHGVLCLPSELETFPMVTVEAQACGCIPVAHNVGGVAATLADGQTGFLYSPNTPEKLAETIIKAMTTIDTDPSIRQRAIDFIRDNLSIARDAEYISKLWDRLTIAKDIGTVRALFESNNMKLAGAGCERLLQKYPDQPDLLLLRALIALHRGDKDGCKSILLSMVEKFGPHQMTLNSLGVLSTNEDDHDKALEYFVKAYNVNTSDRNTALNCSTAWKMCGKYEKARMVLFMYLTKVGADAQVLQLLEEINNLITCAGLEVNVMAQQQKSLSEHKTGDRLTVIPHYEPGPSDPLVSVIMPVYNCAEYIGQSIESVLIQNYPKFELIIVDDGSMDNTREVVLRYDDERITYIYQQNNGPSSARNRAIRQAKGQYIMPLDADDMMTPDCIILHLQEFKKYPEADLIYCDVLLIDGNGNPIRVMNKPEYHDRRHLIRDLFRQGHPIVPFRLGIRRSVFDRIGFYDEQLAMPEDYDMVRRFVKAGLKEHHLRQTLHLRRMQPESLSRSMNINKARDHFEVVSRIVETFDCEQLFPDVNWSKIPAEKKEFHAKCLVGATYLDIGRRYIESKQPIMSQIAFEQARLELNGYIKIDPGNRRIRQLLQKSGLLQAGYEQGVQQAVC